MRQRGAAMIEFVIVGPVLTLLGLAILQYGMLFFAKNQINHAAFMAARAGSMGHASLDEAKSAYIRAMVPMYGGGRNETELAEAFANAKKDVETSTKIELLNPTKESFADWNDPELQAIVGKGKAKGGGNARVIPNSGLAARTIDVKAASGQSIQDANLIKLRITHGYKPKVPLVRAIYTEALKALDSKSDTFYTALLADERIPVVSYVTMQMQSDAIEPENPVSSAGPGNNGTPTDPDPPKPPEPTPIPGNPPQDPVDPPGEPHPPACPDGSTLVETALSDVLFDFDKSTLNDAGKQTLDALIEQAKKTDFESLTVTGFTDPIDSDAYNAKLSKDRATAVRDYLVSHGFPDKPIMAVGKGVGDSPPKTLANCPSGPDQISCLAPDRRVVFTFTKVK